MSYRYKVLSDNPIGFWHLNGTSSLRTYATLLLEYSTYQQWLNTEANYASDSLTFTLEDLSVNNNHAAFIIGQPNFLDILPLATLSSSDAQLAGCKINSSSEIGVPNMSQLYKMFYTGTESLTFGVELWLSFDSNPPSDNTIFSVADGTVAAKAVINNDTVYFTVYGKDKFTNQALSYTVSKQVQSWDSQCHIFLYYSNGSINICVNSIHGDYLTVSPNFVFSNSSADAKNFFYKVGPAATSKTFVINDLAFYDYILSDNLIKSHMIWGTNDSSPQNYVKQTSGSFFDIKETDDMFAYKKDFKNSIDYKSGVINNLIIDTIGLTLQTAPSLTKEGTGTLTTTGALAVTGSASAKFSNFSDYFNFNGVSIIGQINWTLNIGASPTIILSVEGLNSDESIYLAQSADNKLTLYYHSVLGYYPFTASDTVIAQVASPVTSGGMYNFGVGINNNIAKIYLSGKGSSTSSSLPSYSYNNLNLYFGNEYSPSTTLPLSGSLSNISITDTYIDPSTYTKYGQLDNNTITFANSMAISQIGTWTYTVPSSQLSKIVGSRVTWDSGTSDNSVVSTLKNVTVESSIDKGLTWSKVTNGYPATKFADSSLAVYPDTMFRTTISCSDSSLKYLPRFDNALVVLYKNLSVISDDGAFFLSPRQGSYIGDTYSIRKNSFNILARSSNFGININQVSGSNSVATIKSSDIGGAYQTLEFWFRYDGVSTSATQFVMDTQGMTGYINIDPSGGFCSQTGLSNVYINGVDLSTGRVLTKGESYHFVCIFPMLTKATIYLGGDQGLNYFSYGTYGFISLFPGVFSQIDAQNRYLNFLSANTSRVNYTQSIGGASNVIGTISEYAGSSTSFNAGNAILAYKHPTTLTL